MNEYSQYIQDFGSGYWSNPDKNLCRCRGSGWALSEIDTWHQCPCHYKGQRHPEEYEEGIIECANCGASFVPGPQATSENLNYCCRHCYFQSRGEPCPEDCCFCRDNEV